MPDRAAAGGPTRSQLRNGAIVVTVIALVAVLLAVIRGVTSASPENTSGGRPVTPGAPTCPDAGIAANAIRLQWGAAGSGAAAYDIYHDGNKIGDVAGDQTATNLTGLTPNTEYRLSVFARDANGNVSDSSAQAVCRTRSGSDPTSPTAPAALAAAELAASSLTLSWRAATDDQGVTSYEVRSGTTVYKTVTGRPPATTTSVTGLACNSRYALQVVARDAAGNTSPPSNAVSFTTKGCTGGAPSGIRTISTGWSIPWGTYFAPDGRTALVTERDTFRVYRLNRDGGGKRLVGTVPNSETTRGEGGLLGIAFSPTWNGTSDRDLFVMHTSSDGNRVARLAYDGSSLRGYTVVLDGIRKNRFHNGGRIAFGPDGFLYAATGDAQETDLAQDRNSLNGKILRMTKTGQPAPGNPFGSVVYSYGHRNPQGLAWDSRGRLWSAEFGNSRFDELNLVEAGNNYGWPECEGRCDRAGMTNPARQWPVSAASPSGIAIVRDVVYMAALRGERLWRIPLRGAAGTGTPTAYYVGAYGRLRTVTAVPGADQLWLSTTNADLNGKQPDGSDRVFLVGIR